MGRNLTFQEALAVDLARRRAPLTLAGAKRNTGSSGFVASDAGILVRKAPTIDMPVGAFSFAFPNAAAVTLPAIGAEVTVITFTVPQGLNGILTKIANQFVGGGWVEGTGDLVWRLEADGVPIRGYDALISSLGSTSNPADLSRNFIRIFENQVISLIANNVAIVVAAQPLLGLLGGYFYPLEQEGVSEWL